MLTKYSPDFRLAASILSKNDVTTEELDTSNIEKRRMTD